MKEIVYLFLITGFIFSGCEQRILEGNEKIIEPESEELIIDPVEYMPTFPGGEDSLTSYLKKNNQWIAEQSTIDGRVVIGFVVNEKGELKEIEVLKSLCSSCDKEAIRLVENMPNWIPAEENGKPVPKRIMLPISFNGLK
ncbi:energy transducer TonB [Pontibacter virosus]|uniref:TonB family protein n=1 Tax=Pontibacter virosus TaxID=1765052 RepID=A0A2U1AIB4_9BACT|nr:energy transducer TonB [Pontibacter virosus]PVY36123.1 TonB family protein [Pontibacter virosus]